jgi:hypothetical protein
MIFNRYIITFKNSRVNLNLFLRQPYHSVLSGGAFRGRRGFRALAATVGGKGGRLPCLSLAGSMMMLRPWAEVSWYMVSGVAGTGTMLRRRGKPPAWKGPPGWDEKGQLEFRLATKKVRRSSIIVNTRGIGVHLPKPRGRQGEGATLNQPFVHLPWRRWRT